MLKLNSLELHNFGENWKDIKVSFDQNVTYVIGGNGSGKTTLGLTGVWFIMQGIAQKCNTGENQLIGERFRFIGPHDKTATGTLTLRDEEKSVEIKVTRKLTKWFVCDCFLRHLISQRWLTKLYNRRA